jgi:ATP-dependent protease ClpP protease subunit
MIVVNFDDKITSKTSATFIGEIMLAIKQLRLDDEAFSEDVLKEIECEIEKIDQELNKGELNKGGYLSSEEEFLPDNQNKGMYSEDEEDEDIDEVPFRVINLEATYEPSKIIVYFSSQGGDVGCAEKIIDYMNIYREFIVLVGTGVLYSSGFHVFERFEGEKRILNYTTGMLHQIQLSRLRMNPGTGFDEFTRSEIEMYKKDFQRAYEYYKEKGLSKKKLTSFKKGEDVFFSTDELKEFFNLD